VSVEALLSEVGLSSYYAAFEAQSLADDAEFLRDAIVDEPGFLDTDIHMKLGHRLRLLAAFGLDLPTPLPL